MTAHRCGVVWKACPGAAEAFGSGRLGEEEAEERPGAPQAPAEGTWTGRR